MPKTNSVVNDKERHMLIVKFKDGASAELPWDVLRDACPCAECKDLHGTGDPLKLTAMPNKTLTGFEYAGNYAVILIWGDGHRFGIYTWPYLRELAQKLAASLS
ncbi:MAG TPA: DUF971 domain-containing protein [Anaerolineae bacterium]|nr:DUF971 domain-containing protein [Anaerolineae bacterium]